MGKFQTAGKSNQCVRDYNDSAFSHTRCKNVASEGGACGIVGAGGGNDRECRGNWRNPLSWPSCFCIMLIRLYQLTLSPLMPNCCRFYPTCSRYALTAFKEHPLWMALWLTCWRLLRCQPFARGGYDPVPPCRRRK